MNLPEKNEHSDYAGIYINYLPKGELIEILQKTQEYSLEILTAIPVEMHDYRYAEGKWTIKELLLHLNDCEQIMAYRALRFARKDYASALPFDEDAYVAAANAQAMKWEDLIEMSKLLRQTSILMFKGFTEEESKQGGSEIFPNSVRAIAAMIAGHQLHHLYILQERYLKQPIQKFEN